MGVRAIDARLVSGRSAMRWLLGGVALIALAPSVAAQEESGDAAATAARDGASGASAADIIVTGSRLQSSTFTAPTPVQTLSAADIEQRAPTQIADVVNQLPAFRTTRSATGSGSVADQQSGVQSLLDLRGLEPTRTLVLINGK
ncbi:MAG: TonB-dependent receptor plug domain-containing protein, partial [Sphingobium sp.]